MAKKEQHSGKLVKKYRQEAGLTQSGLAEKLGKTQAMVSLWEKNGFINTIQLQEIAVVLGITVELLNTGNEEDAREKIMSSLSKESFYNHLLEEIKYLKGVIESQMMIIEKLTSKK